MDQKINLIDGGIQHSSLFLHMPLFDEITYEEAIRSNLKIMDLTAFTMCRENDLPILVFDMNTKGNLRRVIEGVKTGTIVHK